MSFETWIITKENLIGRWQGTKLWEKLGPAVGHYLLLGRARSFELLKHRELCRGIMSLVLMFCLWNQGTREDTLGRQSWSVRQCGSSPDSRMPPRVIELLTFSVRSQPPSTVSPTGERRPCRQATQHQPARRPTILVLILSGGLTYTPCS